jgi:hypothetical protein
VQISRAWEADKVRKTPLSSIYLVKTECASHRGGLGGSNDLPDRSDRAQRCAMLRTMNPISSTPPEQDEQLDLPELDVEDADDAPSDAGALPLGLPELDGEGDDDVASDLPVDLGLRYAEEQESVLDDDATGTVDGPATLGVTLPERSESLLGSDDERGCGDDDSLGIDELAEARDRTDANGLDDPDAELVVVDTLPELDGGDDDDDGAELDVGIRIDDP